ncbi:MAG: diacylglycerol kinase [Cardiobacteriaceae bacterium]|nr:diacylglycerol kinase [Cardiobacteriaceae bacterium]
MRKENISPSDSLKGRKSGVSRIINALRYSFDGIKAAVEEAGFRELLVIHGILFLLIIFIPFPLIHKMLLVFASGMSLIVELLNTALEAAVDHTSLEIHPLAKRAKDTASAAQYTCLLLIITLWCMSIYAYCCS